jgi:hypothetical protein
MKFTPFILCLAIASLGHAQDAATPPEPVKPKLTPDQVKNVLSQLETLEKSIMQQRGTDLGSIIKRLRTAASSDAACVNLIAECDKLVNVELKDGDRKDAKKIDERKKDEKRPESKKEEEKDGDHIAGVRLCLDYLALTLEAHDQKDIYTMIPKLQAFHQTMMAQSRKLHGSTGEMLMRTIGSGGGRRGENIAVVVQAYNLDTFLQREKWPMRPGDIAAAYDKLIVEALREKKKDEIASAWDTGLNYEVNFRKARMTDGEFRVWEQQEYPPLRWRRAQDLTANGSDPIKGMGEMMKVIKDFPSNPQSPEWIKELRALVASGQPPVAPSGDEKPAAQ